MTWRVLKWTLFVSRLQLRHSNALALKHRAAVQRARKRAADELPPEYWQSLARFV